MPSEKLKIQAEKRKVFGRKVKQLRKKGLLPANIYGKAIKSLSVSVSLKDFLALYKKSGETNIVELDVKGENKSRPVLIHNLQKDPLTEEPLHVDFHQVNLKQKVEVDIPIELRGKAAAVDKGGVLIQLIDKVAVEALPADLPDKIILDIEPIKEIGQGLSFKDLKIDREKIKLLVENEDELIVKVEEPKKEEEAEEKKEEEVKEEEAEEKKEEEVKEEASAEKKEEVSPEKKE